MFKWYQYATKCYVYLHDVPEAREWESDFQQSEWFDRGWTLQEPVAPAVVEFFSVDGVRLGDVKSLERQVHQVSGISIEALRGKLLSQIDQRERLSWTARRQTTVEEDAVYCLLGILDIHVPLLYGEGQQKALAQLQQEIRLPTKPDLYIIKDILWIVPFERSPRFTGRNAELAELEDKLFVRDHTSKIAFNGRR